MALSGVPRWCFGVVVRTGTPLCRGRTRAMLDGLKALDGAAMTFAGTPASRAATTGGPDIFDVVRAFGRGCLSGAITRSAGSFSAERLRQSRLKPCSPRNRMLDGEPVDLWAECGAERPQGVLSAFSTRKSEAVCAAKMRSLAAQ